MGLCPFGGCCPPWPTGLSCEWGNVSNDLEGGLAAGLAPRTRTSCGHVSFWNHPTPAADARRAGFTSEAGLDGLDGFCAIGGGTREARRSREGRLLGGGAPRAGSPLRTKTVQTVQTVQDRVRAALPSLESGLPLRPSTTPPKGGQVSPAAILSDWPEGAW